MREIGNIRVFYDDNKNVKLVIDMDVNNKYDGLESTGESFEEALEDLYITVDLMPE